MQVSDVQILRASAHRFPQTQRPLATTVLNLDQGVVQGALQACFNDRPFEQECRDWTVPDVKLRLDRKPTGRRITAAESEKGPDFGRQCGGLDETHSDIEAGTIVAIRSDDSQLNASNARMESPFGYSCIGRFKGLAELHGVAAASSMQFG